MCALLIAWKGGRNFEIARTPSVGDDANFQRMKVMPPYLQYQAQPALEFHLGKRLVGPKGGHNKVRIAVLKLQLHRNRLQIRLRAWSLLSYLGASGRRTWDVGENGTTPS